jgi:hypothetical protein
MAYRDDLLALSARHDALAGEVAQKTRELEESRQMLEHARAPKPLPMLGQLRVATPCTADWNQMTGDDRTRHCGECQKNVYNLSGMTQDEAEALLIKRNGDVCVRYYQRHDGTILLADCEVGVGRRLRRRKIAAGAAALLAGGFAAAGVAQAVRSAMEIPPRLESVRVTMGGPMLPPGPRQPPPSVTQPPPGPPQPPPSLPQLPKRLTKPSRQTPQPPVVMMGVVRPSR